MGSSPSPPKIWSKPVHPTPTRRSRHHCQPAPARCWYSRHCPRAASSPSPVSRELQRSGCERPYASAAAQGRCHKRRLSARPARKLDPEGVMFGVVRHCLGLRWSPQQIALTLASIYPKGHPYRVSHETIYNCIYAQPVGELKRELWLACARRTTSGCRAARARTGEGRSRTCSASTWARPRSRTVSSPATGKAI